MPVVSAALNLSSKNVADLQRRSRAPRLMPAGYARFAVAGDFGRPGTRSAGRRFNIEQRRPRAISVLFRDGGALPR